MQVCGAKTPFKGFAFGFLNFMIQRKRDTPQRPLVFAHLASARELENDGRKLTGG